MMFSLPTALQVYGGVGTSKSFPSSTGMSTSIPRAPTDPIFSADVVIAGGVSGSHYILVDANNTTTVLASGIITSSTHIIPLVPIYTNPHSFILRIRKSTSSPLYKQIELVVNHSFAGTSIPISQELDE